MWEECRKSMLHTIAKKSERNKSIFSKKSKFQQGPFVTSEERLTIPKSHPVTPPQVSQLPPVQVSQFLGVSDLDPANDLIWVWQYSSCRSRTLLSNAHSSHAGITKFYKMTLIPGNDDYDQPEDFHGKEKCFHLAALPCLCNSNGEYG